MPKTMTQKREGAEERRAAYEARTVEEQLELVAQRPGVSESEKLRLLKRIQAEATQGKKVAKKKGNK